MVALVISITALVFVSINNGHVSFSNDIVLDETLNYCTEKIDCLVFNNGGEICGQDCNYDYVKKERYTLYLFGKNFVISEEVNQEWRLITQRGKTMTELFLRLLELIIIGMSISLIPLFILYFILKVREDAQKQPNVNRGGEWSGCWLS